MRERIYANGLWIQGSVCECCTNPALAVHVICIIVHGVCTCVYRGQVEYFQILSIPYLHNWFLPQSLNVIMLLQSKLQCVMESFLCLKSGLNLTDPCQKKFI